MTKLNKTERRLFTDIFGELKERVIRTNAENIDVGDEVTLINSNCEFGFDNVFGTFHEDLFEEFVVDLKIIGVDYSEFEPDYSNNGGCYAFATCEVVKVYPDYVGEEL